MRASGSCPASNGRSAGSADSRARMSSEIGRQAEDRAGGAQCRGVRRVQHQSAAGGNDQPALAGQFGRQPFLPIAKGDLAIRLEYLVDGTAVAGHHQRVGVHKAAAEPFRQRSTNGRFAGAHEAGEDDVLLDRSCRHGLYRFGNQRQNFGVNQVYHSVRTRSLNMATKHKTQLVGLVMVLVAAVMLAACVPGADSRNRGSSRRRPSSAAASRSRPPAPSDHGGRLRRGVRRAGSGHRPDRRRNLLAHRG